MMAGAAPTVPPLWSELRSLPHALRRRHDIRPHPTGCICRECEGQGRP